MKEEFTSVDLVVFYGARAQKIGREMNYSAEELFEQALRKAKTCDTERMKAIKENRQNDLPYLHGIPISIKE